MNVSKAAIGVRRPSSTLWVMVQRITEDQWRQLKAFSEVYGKGSMQFKLIELLRFMKVYDHQAEKQAFADADLYSLRKKAKAWLIRTGRRLAFATKDVEEQLGDVEMLIAWRHYEDAWEAVAAAKELASAQEEFIVLAGLLEQEKNIAKELFQGDQRTAALQRISIENKANLENLLLVATMAEHTARFLEPVRNKLASTGVLDRAAVSAYFQTDVHHLSIVHLPVTVQIEKLTLDEFFFNMGGDFGRAAEIATTNVELLSQHPCIKAKMPDKLPRLFMNLVAFYSKLDMIDKVHAVIAQFEAESPHLEENRAHYLLRYIFVLFQASIDCLQPALAEKGMATWKKHKEHVLALEYDSMKTITLVCVCWHYLAEGQVEEARKLYYHIKTAPMSMPRLLYQSMLALLHMVILFEDFDEIGLDSIGLQYRRKLRQHLPAGAPALEVITFLRTKANLSEGVARQNALKRLAGDLRRRQSQLEDQRNFWFDPLIKWIAQKTTR